MQLEPVIKVLTKAETAAEPLIQGLSEFVPKVREVLPKNPGGTPELGSMAIRNGIGDLVAGSVPTSNRGFEFLGKPRFELQFWLASSGDAP